MALSLYDYIVIVAYFLFMVGIGFYFLKKSKGGRDFFAGGNMIPWWVSGVSLYMTNFSAWIFTGGAGFAYNVGWFALIYFAGGPIAYMVGTLMTAKLWRRSRSISPIEYTQTRYNIPTQQLFGWVIALNFILSAGVQLAATSKLMAPVLQIDLVAVVLVIGSVILAYSFMGGLWAVTTTDTLQGVIVVSIALVVVPASLYLVGGFEGLIEMIPPLTWSHMYNEVHYEPHWLIALLMITSIGFAAGGAQRFYAVKDEIDARKVGYVAAALSALGPLMFGVPPLVARAIWPDLSKVEFFQPYLDTNPQDLVYFGVCLKILPAGLVGVFLAAMLAATMSTLSSVYNLVSSIFTRDFYQTILRPKSTDADLLKVGRISSFVSGLIVIGLAIVFITSRFGIFNLMQVFFTLFNSPVIIPIAFGLLIKNLPRWSAFAAICWGLVIGVTTRYLLEWDMGPQVYLSLAGTFFVFVVSHWTADLWREKKPMLILASTAVSAFFLALYFMTAPEGAGQLVFIGATASALATGYSLIIFAKLYAAETDAERKEVDEFFEKLATPIDVVKEVYLAGKRSVSTFPLIGGTTLVLGMLMSLVFLTEMSTSETVVLGGIVVVLICVGASLWFFGRRSEIRDAARMREAQERAGQL
jgi:SSS family transporter